MTRTPALSQCLTKKLELCHITGVGEAVNIIKTRVFHPAYDSVWAADAGMNFVGPDGLGGNEPANTGAQLRLRWDGPVGTALGANPAGSCRLFTPDILVSDPEHLRYFLPLGSRLPRLRIVGVDFDSHALDRYLKCEKWPTWWRRWQWKFFESRLRHHYINKECFLLITGEPIF